jgi:TonB family protein
VTLVASSVERWWNYQIAFLENRKGNRFFVTEVGREGGVRRFAFFSGTRVSSVLGTVLLGIGSGIPTPAQTAPAPKVLASGSDLDVVAPKLIHWVAAQLSDEGRIANYRGICLVSLVVDEKGRPENVHVIRQLGMGLDSNAIKAAKQFRFIPAMNDDKPISEKVTVEVHFKLDPRSEAIAQ